MGNQDPDQLHETILTLTLEIIYLLTGEGYSVTKKSGDDMPLPQSCTDCMLGGACRHHVTSPTVAPPPGSVIQKENAKKILELMSNIIQLLTGEVAIRCEDVSLYFSLEEWQYLKGNKTRYREVIKENWEQLRPLGCEWDVGADVRNANKPDKTEAEEADSWGEGNPPNPDISPTDPQTLTNCISHGIKEESWEEEEHCEWNTDPPTEQIQGTDPPTDTVGSHLNISQSDNHSDIKGALYSWGEGNPPNPDISPTDPQTLTHCISHGINKEMVSWAEGLNPYCGMSPHTEQIAGTVPPTGIRGSNPNIRLSGSDRKELGTPDGHRISHIREKPFSCYKCTKCFAHQSRLASHLRKHSAERPLTCTVCKKCFAHQNALNRHVKSHTGDKSFCCSECGKCFTHDCFLKVHLRSHTGEKPFSCSECGRCFAYQGDLRRHSRIHTGNKPYCCTECGKCFGQKYPLALHMRSHTGEKPFTCSECGKSYKMKRSLIGHMRAHRGGTL
ncbi:oocyte zinc finger protein XlCOF8.4-like isoform X2 [Xenopus laevis]|nr:oocyte zinc finger protein XlCOF8.4-like isoform X2 [Xenopus laevis]